MDKIIKQSMEIRYNYLIHEKKQYDEIKRLFKKNNNFYEQCEVGAL